MIWGPDPYLDKKCKNMLAMKSCSDVFIDAAVWHKPTEFWRLHPAEQLTTSRENCEEILNRINEDIRIQTWSGACQYVFLELVFNYQGLKIRNISRFTHWHLLHARHTFVRADYHEGTSEISPPVLECWSVGMTDGQRCITAMCPVRCVVVVVVVVV